MTNEAEINLSTILKDADTFSQAMKTLANRRIKLTHISSKADEILIVEGKEDYAIVDISFGFGEGPDNPCIFNYNSGKLYEEYTR